MSKKYVSKELAKEIHAKAAPFVKWLKEAEEESEGSEEEGEEEDESVEVMGKHFPQTDLERLFSWMVTFNCSVSYALCCSENFQLDCRVYNTHAVFLPLLGCVLVICPRT